jgi:hypothetical protein
MITKKAGIDYPYDGNALTLEVGEVSENRPDEGTHSRTHDDGWTITGEILEDYYRWVNDFNAQHPTLGHVWGNFETEVYADSEEAFADFFARHTPTAWDYQDI